MPFPRYPISMLIPITPYTGNTLSFLNFIHFLLYPNCTLSHYYYIVPFPPQKTIYTMDKKIKIWCLFHVIPFPRYTKPTLSTFLRYPFSTFFWCLLHVIPFPLLFFDAFSTLYLLRQYLTTNCRLSEQSVGAIIG